MGSTPKQKMRKNGRYSHRLNASEGSAQLTRLAAILSGYAHALTSRDVYSVPLKRKGDAVML